MALPTVDELPLRLKYLRLMLRPLVKFCMKGSHSLGEFLQVLKIVYVELAAEEMERSKQRISHSKLSIMTGVHRQDVKRIYEDGEVFTKKVPSLIPRIISTWESHADFTTKSNKPKVLRYDGESGEFAELVFFVSKNLHPGTILFELERTGMVSREGNKVRLTHDLYRNATQEEDRFHHLALNVETLLNAAEENLFEEQPIRNVNLRTDFDNIFVERIPAIRAWLLEESKIFHKRVREFLSQYDKDVNPDPSSDTAGARVVLGTYSVTVEPEHKDL